MKIDPVFLLVALAFALMVFLPIFDRDRTLSKSFKSSRRRRVLFGRLAVIVLLLAALITLMWRIEGMHSLVQGVLVSALVLVPAYVAHLLASLFYRSSDSDETIASEAEHVSKYQHGVRPDADILDFNNKHNKNADVPETTETQSSVNDPIDFGIDTIPVIHLPSDTGLPDNFDFADIANDIEEKSSRGVHKPIANAAVLSGIPKPYKDEESSLEFDSYSTTEHISDYDVDSFSERRSSSPSMGSNLNKSADREKPDVKGQPAIEESAASAVEEQVSRVSQYVQSHDIGTHSSILIDADGDGDADQEESETIVPKVKPSFDDMVPVKHGSDDYELMERSQITGLVTSLRRDNGRLQKLVLAQHAVIEAERESSNRNKDVARDAIKIMREARSGQKMAEKIARRERAERHKVQGDYEKLTNIFENAMSTISQNRRDSSFQNGA